MTYEEAKTMRNALEAAVKAVKFPEGTGTGTFSLTPDAVKATTEYREAKDAYNAAFAALRRFNSTFVKVYADAIRDERRLKGK